MPWRGPNTPGEFPTLGYVVADWIEDKCAIPDRHVAGERFRLTDEQLRFLLYAYRLRPGATYDPERPSAAFVYNGAELIRPQKWGKGPLYAAITCAEGEGPVLFAGWDANGEPVGRPWPTPHIQITAISEDQTDNIWRALLPMIELGDIAADITDTGLSRINLASGGIIEPVTAAAKSRLGQRITCAIQDELQSWVQRGGGIQLADTQRRNLAGTGGRWFGSGNAYDPAEASVMQTDVEETPEDVYIDFPQGPTGSWRNKRERRKVLRFAYSGAPWVDVERIEADCDRLAKKGDPGQAERFFGNRVVATADAAFDPAVWKKLGRPGATIEPGRPVTLGFDGARRRDSTGLVATDIETGLQVVVGVWERPPDLPADDDTWEINEGDVTDAVAEAFDRWNVWRMYADPPYWESTVDRWAGEYGKDRVVHWWTNRRRPMAYALKAYRHAMIDADVTHDANPTFATHIANARRQKTGSVDEDGLPLWIVQKDRPDSPRKIDLSVCGCLSWEARGDALAAGVLNQPAKKSRQLVTF